MKLAKIVLILQLILYVLSISAYAIDQETPCDTYAADPFDKQHRWAEGVLDEELLVNPAIIACDKALRENPFVARFYLQLGRGYYLKGLAQPEEINNFTLAQYSFEGALQYDSNYGAAYAYLAEMAAVRFYQHKGEFIVDNELARKFFDTFYEKAVQNGYPISEDLFEQVMQSDLDFAANELNLPTFVYSLYLGDFENIPDNFESRKLLLSLIAGYSELCDKWSVVAFDTVEFTHAKMIFSYPLMIDKANKFNKHLPGTVKRGKQLLNEVINIDFKTVNLPQLINLLAQYNTLFIPFMADTEMLRPAAKQDGATLTDAEYFGCTSKIANQFVENLKHYMVIKQKSQPSAAYRGENELLYQPYR